MELWNEEDEAELVDLGMNRPLVFIDDDVEEDDEKVLDGLL